MSGQVAPFTVHRFEDIDSTQRYVLDEARRGAPAGLVAVARHQSAGRGRLGRRWEAPAGANLLMSVLLRPTLPVAELHLCTVAVALAALDACATVGVGGQLKWPNDVMVRDRKLAGILAEAIAGAPPGPPVAAVVVGLGLNVRWPPPESDASDVSQRPAEPDESDPAAIAQHATSVWRETGGAAEPETVLEAVLVALAPRLAQLDGPVGRRSLSEQYRRRCATVGRRVRASTATGTVTGVATGVTDEGHLVVDTGDATTTVAAGDVVHLRDG